MKYRLLGKRIATIGRKIGKGVTTCVNRILDYEKDERMPATAHSRKIGSINGRSNERAKFNH